MNANLRHLRRRPGTPLGADVCPPNAEQFDWEEVYHRLDQDPQAPEGDRFVLALRTLLIWLTSPAVRGERYVNAVGLRTLALCWVLDPERYFRQPLSLKKLARRVQRHRKTLDVLTGQLTRDLGIRNGFQGHAWNRRPRPHRPTRQARSDVRQGSRQ